jgi:hypothetical protein
MADGSPRGATDRTRAKASEGAERPASRPTETSPLEQGIGRRISIATAFLLAVPVASPWGPGAPR